MRWPQSRGLRVRTRALLFNMLWQQGRNEVRWRPGQEAGSVPPCSNLRSFGSKCTVLKKVVVTLLGLFGATRSDTTPGNCAPLPPLVTPLSDSHSFITVEFACILILRGFGKRFYLNKSWWCLLPSRRNIYSASSIIRPCWATFFQILAG